MESGCILMRENDSILLSAMTEFDKHINKIFDNGPPHTLPLPQPPKAYNYTMIHH